jgi:hypothetical protein
VTPMVSLGAGIGVSAAAYRVDDSPEHVVQLPDLGDFSSPPAQGACQDLQGMSFIEKVVFARNKLC